MTNPHDCPICHAEAERERAAEEEGVDPRKNPCPECDEGEVLTAASHWGLTYRCSNPICNWSG